MQYQSVVKDVILSVEDADGKHLHSAEKNKKMNYFTEIHIIFNIFIFEYAGKATIIRDTTSDRLFPNIFLLHFACCFPTLQRYFFCII